ncbi:MAG: PhaM family polyhydroxyalkanoate granule multifunctional regulatory protein [Pusillimonas sp.]
MTSSNTNPFALPGFAQMGDATQNPMLASMEMMRHAWQNLAGAGAGALGGGAMVAPPMTVEELDRRINELRTVENWLRMNLSMLSSTIQGMEVQRATIATLKAFVSPEAESGSAEAPSALEVALGLKPSGQARIKPASEAPAARPAGSASFSSFLSSASPEPAQGAAPAAPALPGAGSADAWWGMLQQQFDSLATATAAGLKNAESVAAAAGKAATSASENVASTVSSVSTGLGKAAAGVEGQAKPVRAAKKAQPAAEASPARSAVKPASTSSRAPRKRASTPKSAS